MCLTIKKRQIQTADGDIVVFKLLAIESSGFYSPIFRTEWKVGETKTVLRFSDQLPYGEFRNIRFTDKIPEHVRKVYEGLHSYTKIPWWADLRLSAVFKMIIPKDSKYIIGENDEVVSLALRFDSAERVTTR